MNIFLSYTVRDGMLTRDRLRRIAKGLQEFSSPYVDLLEHRCGGHQPSVRNALLNADAFLLCMTPRVFYSPWVALEYTIALQQGIPIYAMSLASWLAAEHADETWRHRSSAIKSYFHRRIV